MSVSDSGAGSASTAAATAEPEQRIAYLDKALWNRLASAGSPQEMAEFWLKLQCSMIDDVAHAVLYRCSDERGTLLPAAFWFGASDQRSNALLKTAQRAITEGKGVVSGHRTDAAGRAGHYCCSAYPFILDGKSWGAVALEVADRSEEQLRAVMRQLQWGAAWIEVKLRQQQASAGDQRRAQSIVALDLIAAGRAGVRRICASVGYRTGGPGRMRSGRARRRGRGAEPGHGAVTQCRVR